MMTLIPVVKRICEKEPVFIERVMPVAGSLYVKIGDSIEPYSHIGDCMYAQKTTIYPASFKPKGLKKIGQFYYMGMVLGSQGKEKISASYDGYFHKNEKGQYVFDEVERKYTLLSGVWGVVDKTIDKIAVQIRARVKDVALPVATNDFFSGELVVFPNPSTILEKFYLDEFSAQSADGKIVYVGNHANMQLLNAARTSRWGGILAGSTDLETYTYAKENNINFGVFTGFGDINTPDDVYALLNEVSNRYVFFNGPGHILRIPVPPAEFPDDASKKPILMRAPKKGDNVLILKRQYFGMTGVVDRVQEFSILVRFQNNQKSVEVELPNLMLLE